VLIITKKCLKLIHWYKGVTKIIAPELIQVYANDDYSITCQFVDGKVTRFDMNNLINRGVFAKLQDRKIFEKSLTILNNTAAWDLSGNRDETKCVDIDRWMLYESEELN